MNKDLVINNDSINVETKLSLKNILYENAINILVNTLDKEVTENKELIENLNMENFHI